MDKSTGTVTILFCIFEKVLLSKCLLLFVVFDGEQINNLPLLMLLCIPWHHTLLMQYISII